MEANELVVNGNVTLFPLASFEPNLFVYVALGFQELFRLIPWTSEHELKSLYISFYDLFVVRVICLLLASLSCVISYGHCVLCLYCFIRDPDSSIAYRPRNIVNDFQSYFSDWRATEIF